MGGRVVTVVVSRWVCVWMVCEARRGYTQTGSVNGDIWVCVRLQFMQADSRRRMCSGHERVCVFAHAQLVARPTIACHQQDSRTRRLLAHDRKTFTTSCVLATHASVLTKTTCEVELLLYPKPGTRWERDRPSQARTSNATCEME
jgi:hypothetical protein